MGAFAYGAWRGASKAVRAGAIGLALLAAPAWAETATVVALGDSLTAGYGLPPGRGFVGQLQGWLDANGVDATIVNAGVSGDTTAGGLARIDWALSPEADAMIVTLGGNDMLRGMDPAGSRANLDAILAKVAGERGLPVLLIGMEAPGNYGGGYKAAFDAMYPDLAAKWGALAEPSFFAPLLVGDTLAEARRKYFLPDGIHPNDVGVAKIVAAIGPRVAELVARVGS